MGFPGGSNCKEPTCNAGDLGLIPELGRPPGGGHGNPLQYSCLENPHGQRSKAGYSRKESDTTEQPSTVSLGALQCGSNVKRPHCLPRAGTQAPETWEISSFSLPLLP